MVEEGPRDAAADGFDLEKLKASIRTAADQRRRGEAPPPALTANDRPFLAHESGQEGPNWALLSASVSEVERLCDPAGDLPASPALPRLLRFCWRLLMPAIRLATRLLTWRQRQCNHAVLIALRNLHYGLQSVAEQQKAKNQDQRPHDNNQAVDGADRQAA